LYLKAALVDHAALASAQKKADIVEAEEVLKDAYNSDVRPILADWRTARGLAPQPLKAFRASGYNEKMAEQRGKKNKGSVSSYA
jgi:L-rhamnose isomerase / sugar isomerase